MSNTVPTYYIQEFASNVELLLQQKGSKLRDTCTVGSYTGNQASPVEQVAATAARRRTTRYPNLDPIDVPADRRWVFPEDFDWNTLIDNMDKLRMRIDPQGAYTQSALFALGRAMDDVILNNMFGAARTGNTGATVVNFGTALTTAGGQNVGVNVGGAASGLNVAKLREARRALMAAEVDMDAEEPTILVTSRQHDNLLGETAIQSLDFNERPVLVDGKVTRFMGFRVIHIERLPTGTDDAAGTSRAVPVYVKSGMHLAMWDDIKTDISQRKDKAGLPYQIYAYGTFGATRIEERRLVRIWCRE